MKWVVSGKLRYEENKWVSKTYETKEEAEKVFEAIYNKPNAKFRLYVILEVDDKDNRRTLQTLKLG